MSTNAVVAVPHGDAWRGRYVHSDGYPTHTGAQLWAIVQRDGLARARAVLVDEHPAGWSLVDAHDKYAHCAREIHDVIGGYGHAYNDDPGWWVETAESWDWVYILGDASLIVLKGAHRAEHRWDAAEPDWEAVEGGRT